MWKLNWTELGIDLDRLKEVLTYDAAQPMIFSSGFFLLLFLGFSLVYLLLQKRTTARLLFVTLFSYYFYYKSSGTYFFLLGIVTVSDFLLARRMEMTVEHWKRKMLVVCSLCINLGLLCYFKYTNFFYEMLAPLWNGRFEPLDIFLPVGISFFTFQSLSYTIDVYRRDLKPLSVCWIMLSMCLSSRSWWQDLSCVPAISFRKSAGPCPSRPRCSVRASSLS